MLHKHSMASIAVRSRDSKWVSFLKNTSDSVPPHISLESCQTQTWFQFRSGITANGSTVPRLITVHHRWRRLLMPNPHTGSAYMRLAQADSLVPRYSSAIELHAKHYPGANCPGKPWLYSSIVREQEVCPTTYELVSQQRPVRQYLAAQHFVATYGLRIAQQSRHTEPVAGQCVSLACTTVGLSTASRCC